MTARRTAPTRSRARPSAGAERGQVLVLTKENSGKAEALNFGLELRGGGDIRRHRRRYHHRAGRDFQAGAYFADPEVAAVAGNTKVGNRVNLWTRWQALEYITSQNFERRALDDVWRGHRGAGGDRRMAHAAVRDAGGFHLDTVAEDADLTMSLLEAGYVCTTKIAHWPGQRRPPRASGLMRQRFRWSFGILQAVWKHRGLRAQRHAGVGGAAQHRDLPDPAAAGLALHRHDVHLGALSYAVDRYFHPDAAEPATSSSWWCSSRRSW